MLWKYNDPETCQQVRKGDGGLICLKTNMEPECVDTLERAAWLPGWDEFALGLASLPGAPWNGTSLTLPTRNNKACTLEDWKTGLFVAHKPMVYLTKEQQRNTNLLPILESDQVKDRLQQLFSTGPERLFGMLFRELLSFQRSIYPPDLYPIHRKPTAIRTCAIHSPHFDSSYNAGTTISSEMRCLKSLLPKSLPCIIYIVSDRAVTIDKLKACIHERYPRRCQAVVASHHSDTSASLHCKEHGPFAGIVGSQARNGFIGHCHRTFSQLLRELIEYDRTGEALQSTGIVPTTELPTCCLPST